LPVFFNGAENRAFRFVLTSNLRHNDYNTFFVNR